MSVDPPKSNISPPQQRDVVAFKYNFEKLELSVLDQRQLPTRIEYFEVNNIEDSHHAIKQMMVRGAPAIAAFGCISIVMDLLRRGEHLFERDADFLLSARPTAVNLKKALDQLREFVLDKSDLASVCTMAVQIGLECNMRMGQIGATEILSAPRESGSRVRVLTHCNTGALATVGHGTALGVIRTLHGQAELEEAFCTETRPYNQGSRLTAWELSESGIPSRLIADSMVAFLMAKRMVNAVVVGADRIARNGDTANKVGTLQIAVTAKHFNVPFYVAATRETFDEKVESGDDIPIETRVPDELKKIGDHWLAPKEMQVWNPCFDVTPVSLITGFITEEGLWRPQNGRLEIPAPLPGSSERFKF